MKTDRKLKRGLAELSNLFSLSGDEYSPKRRNEAPLAIEPPADTLADIPPPDLTCVAFCHAGEIVQLLNLHQFSEAFKTAFQEIYLLSVSPNRAGDQTLEQALAIPIGEDYPDLCFRSIDRGVTFGRVSFDWLYHVIQPKALSNCVHDFTAEKKAIAIFDSVVPDDSVCDPMAAGLNIFELLDHCVFVTQPNSDQLVQTYDQIRFCLTRNRALRCSILLIGRDSEAVWEFVYERLNAIASQFLGQDLGFLGWAEGNKMQLNPCVLLEGGGNLVQLSSKVRLSETLWRLNHRSQQEISNGAGALMPAHF